MTRHQAGVGGLGLLLGMLGLLLGVGSHPTTQGRLAWAAGSNRVFAPTDYAAPSVPNAVGTVLPTVRPTTDRPRIAGPSADHRLDRSPSVSAATIERVLAEYGSPAAGQGATFYDLGLQYGIDPAYALAFYIQESSAGTQGVARVTHSIGNIRVTPGYASYEGYRSYASYAAGIADWYQLIKTLYIGEWGLTTPSDVTPRYAPWGDRNNPVQYATNVTTLVDSWWKTP